MSMEEDKPPLNVSHDQSIQFVVSDLSGTPNASPNTSMTRAMERTKSIDAKLKRKWKSRVEKEKAYERANTEKAENAKEQPGDADMSTSFIELTQDLLGPCVDDSACSEQSPDEREVTNLADLSDSLVDPVEPPVVTPDVKASHKVLAKMDTSGEKYSQKDEEYYKFHEGLYAPQEDEYLSFLKGLESESGDPSAEDFAKWLQGMETDLLPIAPQTSPDTPENMKDPVKKVAFSKETTVRFFSRTREELLQLKQRYKKTIGGGDSLNENECGDDDFPLFKYLDNKLKEMEESSAWDDPMSAVTDMLVSKEVKEKISPMICVCEEPVEESVQESNDSSRSLPPQESNDPSRALADLDEDEDFEPATELPTTRAAASMTITEARKEQSLLSYESSEKASSTSPLWFAESFKKPHDESPDKGDSFVRPAPSPSSSKSSSPTKSSSSSTRITIEAPKSLSVVKESTRSTEDMQVPDDPTNESLSWLAKELDESPDAGGRSILSVDPLNDSSLSHDKSLGRNTNSNLLKQVSEHLNVSVNSVDTTNSSSIDQEEDLKAATALKTLLEPPDNALQETNAKESGIQTVTVSVAELDVLVRSNGKHTRTQLSTDMKDAVGRELVSSRSSEGSDSSTPFDQKRHVVKAAKRWAASQKAGHHSTSSSLSSTGSVQQRRKQIQVVKAAKRRTATQKASTKPMQLLSPTPEDGLDLDESRDWHGKPVSPSIDISEATDVWEGVKVTPRSVDSSRDWHGKAASPSVDISEATDVWDGVKLTPRSVDLSDPSWRLVEEGPDMDESKEWDAFGLHPDMTTTTVSVSNDDASLEETEEWVAFASDGAKSVDLLNEPWPASFPNEETAASTGEEVQVLQTTCADPVKSPRKQVRVSPVKQAQAAPCTRVQQIAREFERRHGTNISPTTVEEKEKWDISPLTPSTAWVDVDRREDTDLVENDYPDLQQPVLDDSPVDSNNNSPVS